MLLPQSLGGIKTFNTAGDVIMRSTNDLVEIFVSLHVDADAVVDGTLTVHADFTVDGVSHLGGTLYLDADLDAQDHRITGAELETSGGGILIAGDLIDFGGGVAIAGDSGTGELFLGGGAVVVNDLEAAGDVRAVNFIPWTVPSITGSRGGNAALADLLSSLDGLGLISDGTTA